MKIPLCYLFNCFEEGEFLEGAFSNMNTGTLNMNLRFQQFNFADLFGGRYQYGKSCGVSQDPITLVPTFNTYYSASGTTNGIVTGIGS